MIEATIPAAAETKTRFGDLKPGAKFDARGNRWHLRPDGLVELMDRHGCVSFIGGRRHFQDFSEEELVEV